MKSKQSKKSQSAPAQGCEHPSASAAYKPPPLHGGLSYLSPLDQELIIAALNDIIYHRAKAELLHDKFSDKRQKLLLNKRKLQRRLAKLGKKQRRFGAEHEYSDALSQTKKEVMEQISSLKDKIEKCSRNIAETKKMCEQEYSQENIRQIFDNMPTFGQARETLDFLFETIINSKRIKLEKERFAAQLGNDFADRPDEDISKELEDMLKDIRYRHGRLQYIQKCMKAVEKKYTDRQLELLRVQNRIMLNYLLVSNNVYTMDTNSDSIEDKIRFLRRPNTEKDPDGDANNDEIIGIAIDGDLFNALMSAKQSTELSNLLASSGFCDDMEQIQIDLSNFALEHAAVK